MEAIAFDATPEDAKERLDRALRRHLAALGIALSVGDCKRLVEHGRVRVEGRRVDRASTRLRPGERVTVERDAVTHATARTEHRPVSELGASAILFEDESLVAIDKPSGLPTDATRDPKRDHAVRAAARLLASRDGAAPELFPVHRLDADTSGVVLLAKSREAAAGLGAAFADRRVEKRYDAVVWESGAPLPERVLVRHYLSSRGGRSTVVRAGGDLAETEIRVVARAGDRALVEARPLTGRTHQIRVALAELGAPILGDRLYAPAETKAAPRLLLHARELSFVHPASGEPVHIVAPTPSALSLDAV